MQVRLLGSGVELLRSGFKAKSNLFEYVLAGETIPEQVRKDIKLKVNGGYTLTMAFEGEPLPCTQCEVTSHTTMGCPVIAAKREKAKCYLCGKEGHIQIACPQRTPPSCHACGEHGHFKGWCPVLSVKGKATWPSNARSTTGGWKQEAAT